MHFYAYHGCHEEEQKIGGNYIVDVIIETDFLTAAQFDDLSKTIDYCGVYEVSKKEMKKKSKLIETVGKRIFDTLKKKEPTIKKLQVKITKLNPPINGNVEKVSVVISE